MATKKRIFVEPAAFFGERFICHADYAADDPEPGFTVIRRRDQATKGIDGREAVIVAEAIKGADTTTCDTIIEIAFERFGMKASGLHFSHDGAHRICTCAT